MMPEPLCQVLWGAIGCFARAGDCSNSKHPLSGLTPLSVAKCVCGDVVPEEAATWESSTAEQEERKQNLTQSQN